MKARCLNDGEKQCEVRGAEDSQCLNQKLLHGLRGKTKLPPDRPFDKNLGSHQEELRAGLEKNE